MINVYITNLAKYIEGELVGQWVSLPLPPEELDEVIEEILGDDEEYFITDYECEFMEVPEYCDIYELNELAEKLDSLDEHELKKVEALMEWRVFSDLEEAIENIDNYILLEDIENEEDLAMYYIYDEDIYNIPDFIKDYIDYKRLGRDLAMDGYISKYGYIYEC
jgi:hypothetical protein